MTYSFFNDLIERKQQVRHYLVTVAKFERSSKLGGTTRTQEGRLLTLRAGTFLILYNLVEATTRGSIEAIHDKITTRGVVFPALTLSLRKMVVSLFKKEADPARNHSMVDIPAEFVAIAMALDENFKLSGSVDARAICELGNRYGFSCDVRDVARGGSDLLVVKRNRNDLAHGLKTFEEIGRNYTATDLVLIARRTMHYMTDITANITKYLDDENYIEKQPR